jgi:dienelactone hydrolase
MTSRLLTGAGAALALSTALLADGPKDNAADSVRPVPPPGVELTPEDKQPVEKALAEFTAELNALRELAAKKPQVADLLPDVEVFHKSVDWALRFGEIFKKQELAAALSLIEDGRARAKALRDGQAPWTRQTGLVVRGYRSRIDGSVQPYGLVIPSNITPDGTPGRLDFWCHGRGETLSELSFIDGRRKSAGEFTPKGGIVAHLYGRYCNANKFAGEIDLLEALAHIKSNYSIDASRIVIRGFSMGGAAAWQFAVHYPGLFAAAAPGAGFSETPDFLKVFQNETLTPSWYEKKLWRMYDATGYALNLANLPTVAYSGEVDKQKQAADQMEAAAAKEGLSLTHLIGPATGHKYHPDSKLEINRRIDAIVAKGRDETPERVRFVTYSLRYPESHWVKLEGLAQHWERSSIDARIDRQKQGFVVSTKNVTRFTLRFESGHFPFDADAKPAVSIDGANVLAGVKAETDRSWVVTFEKSNGVWAVAKPSSANELRKTPGLQGPVDDAFLDRFVMVKPSGKPMHPATGKWVESEMTRALEHWRRQFRGEISAVADSAVADETVASSNLVLWGDPSSNAVLAKIADRLPVKWSSTGIEVRGQKFSAAEHVPILIYPNPLNPSRYVVLNSGFTYREYDYLNNARQTPKLPDWAIVDVRSDVGPRFPGKVTLAGFFGERWEVRAAAADEK